MSNFISVKLEVVSLLLSIERHLRWNILKLLRCFLKNTDTDDQDASPPC